MKYLSDFLEYFPKVRERTTIVMNSVPADHVDWAYQEGKFTIGDILRHLAVIERYTYAEVVVNRPSRYTTHDRSLAPDLDSIKHFMEELHIESMEIFSSLTEKAMLEKCTTPAGIVISRWKWLRAMIEHEIHHRGQLYLYLGLLGVETRPIFKMTAEELAALGGKP